MVPALIDMSTGRMAGGRAVVWTVAFVAFGAAYGAWLRPAARDGRWAVVLLAIEALAGLALTAAASGATKYLSAITLTIVAGQLPHALAPTSAYVWLVAQASILAVMFWSQFGWVAAVSAGGAFAAFHVFNYGQGLLERELAAKLAQLQTAQRLLADRAKSEERLRIARDLHDALGHHLTALSLRLELAARSHESGPAALAEAHALTRLLLGDLRNVVSELRGAGLVDVAPALRALTTGGDVVVTLDIPVTLFVDDAGHANALIRCVQEAVTNAHRHGGASHLHVTVTPEAGGIGIHARDDGHGTERIVPGHGLTGMRERFEALSGWVRFTSARGQGFEVRAFLPRALERP